MRFVRSESYFPIIFALHLLMWAAAIALYGGELALVEGESEVARVVGEMLSSWVVTIFGFNLLMTTRLPWVERLFGGLDKMYLIHRRSGIVAGVVLLLHFAVVPRHPDFSIGKPLGFAAMVLILIGIGFAAAPVFKRKLPYQKWVKGHRIMGLFYLVGVAHSLAVPSLTARLPIVRGYVYGVALAGVAAWLYRAGLSRLHRVPVGYRVQRVQRFGQASVDLELQPTEKGLVHRAGQFAFFRFPDLAPDESHPFTVASGPSEGTLRVVVKKCGDFTSRLVTDVAEGNTVQVEGPYGHLTRDKFGSRPQLWIAGGIGITPFLALADAMGAADPPAQLWWTVSTAAEAHFDEELHALAERRDGLEYRRWVTADEGYLDLEALGGAAVARERTIVICGPVAMRDSLIAQLRDAGVPQAQIHSEEFAFR